MVKSNAGTLSFKLKCKGDNVLNAKGKRIHVWNNYTKLSVNGKNIFGSVKPAWRDKPQKFDKKVKDGQMLDVQVVGAPECACIGLSLTKVNSEYEKGRKLAKEQSELMAQQR